MPKRVKTPPPPEDEPRYLVVVHPYPLNANLLLHADRRALALWLACCTGKDVLYAMFYKPTSAGMIIIEVDRNFDRFDSLLGLHNWESFLKQPTEEDKGKASKIFWCLYNSGRLVQKNGWKRVDIEEHWFSGWSPSNNIIKHPYPKTKYCDVPPEPKTGAPLCRPLPKDSFTPPPPRPRPTVGSAEWLSSRSEAPSSSRRRRGNNGQIAPSDNGSVRSSSTSMSGVMIGALPPPPNLSKWLADQQEKQPIWPKAPSTISSSFTLSSSTNGSSYVESRAPSALGVTTAAAHPPSTSSIPARPSGSVSAPSALSLQQYESFDWSDEVDRGFEAQQGDIPTSPQSASTARAPIGHTAPPRRAPEPAGAIEPDRGYDYDEEDVPKRSTSDAMKDIFHGAPKGAASVENAGLHNLEEEEEELEDDYLAWNYPHAVDATTREWSPADDEVDPKNPWDRYDAPRMEPPVKINIKGGEEWICPEHGSTCSPGICKARAYVEHMRRKEKERDERQEAKKKRQEKFMKAAERRERKAQAEGRKYDPPPHVPYQYKGAGGSGSESEDSDSPSDSHSSSDNSPPQHDVAGTEGWPEEGSLWDDGHDAAPKVSLPSGSASGSNRIEGEDEERSVGGPRTSSTDISRGRAAPTAPQQSARAVSSSAWSTPASARGEVTAPSSAQAERSQFVESGDARRAASNRPASASSRGGGAPTTSQSPPAPRRQAWGNRAAASPLSSATTSANGGFSSSQWPPPGQSQSSSNPWTANSSLPTRKPDADAAPAPSSRQGNGRQRDRGRSESTGGSSTLSDHRSTGGSRSPTSPPGNFLPFEGGFPTHADTSWGDPIAKAQASSARKKSTTSSSNTNSAPSRSAVDADIVDWQTTGDNGRDDVEVGQEIALDTRTRRGRRANTRGGRRGTARKTTTAPVAATAPRTSQPEDVAHPNVLDVVLPPGGPGTHWSNENVEW